MNEQQKYDDPIISIFQKKDEKKAIDKDAIRSLIDKQPQSDDAIIHCETVLKIYTELLKIEFYMNKSWNIKTLIKSTLVKFDLLNDEMERETKSNDDGSFYKDIALKCVKDCDKFSKRLQNFQDSVNSIRECINSMQDRILQDSVTLLLELWFTCNTELHLLKNKIAGVFIRSKVLLIDNELESLKFQLSDTKIITSYKSFMKILVEQLQDSEVSQDQASFDQCLQVFMDIEAMYNRLNFNWLVTENRSLQDSLSSASDTVNGPSTYDEQESDLLSPISLGSLNEHSRSSSMSGSTDLSLMMERTNLSKELPSLLTAFDNAKRMEQEIENVRTVPSSSTSLHASNTLQNHQQPFLPSSSLFRSKLMMMDQQQSSLNHFTSSANSLKPLSKNGNVLSNLYGSR